MITGNINDNWKVCMITGKFVTKISDIRLINGNSEYEGRLEITHDGEWGTVCNDYFSDRDAHVVCRQLGYGGGVAVKDGVAVSLILYCAK